MARSSATLSGALARGDVEKVLCQPRMRRIEALRGALKKGEYRALHRQMEAIADPIERGALDIGSGELQFERLLSIWEVAFANVGSQGWNGVLEGVAPSPLVIIDL